MLAPDNAPAVFFDWDGTLLDSGPATAVVWREVLGGLGISVSGAILTSLFRMGWPAASDWLGQQFSMPPQDELAALLVRERTRHVDLVTLFDDAVPCLRRLRAEGVRIALVTSSSRQRLADDLSVVHVPDGLVDVVVTGDDVDVAKPAPEAYLLALRRLGGTPIRRLAVEDSTFGATSARRAGLPVAYLQRESAGPGASAPVKPATGVHVITSLAAHLIVRLLWSEGAHHPITT